MRATVVETKKKDYTWLIIIGLLLISILFEFIAGQALYNASHDSILSAQDFMKNTLNLKIFYDEIESKNEGKKDEIPDEKKDNNTDLKMDYLYSFLEEENQTIDNNTKKINSDQDNKSKVFISEFIHLINSNVFYLILCAIFFCFVNIYKVFILSMTVFCTNFISSTLSYIFHSPKPYMVFYKIKPGVIFNEWGSPNAQIMVLVSFSLSLYKVLTENKVMEVKLWAKICLMVILPIYSFIDIFLLFAAGNCTYNQIILSLFMGVIIFIVIFYAFKVNLNNSKQFYDFIKFKIRYYLVINLLLFAFQVLLDIFIIDNRDIEFYKKNAMIQINDMPSNSFSNSYCKYRKLFYLNSGNFCNLICFLMNIIAFLAIKLDLHMTYMNNYNSWSQGNFEKPRIDTIGNNLDQSGVAEYNNIEQSQWNHNGVFAGIIRLIVILLITIVIFSLFILISSWSDSEIYAFIFLITIPMTLFVSGIFYLFKPILTKIRLGRPPKIKSQKLKF